MVWGRDKVAKAAQEIADHLKLIEHVKALQTGQKDLAAAIARLDDRLRMIEAEIRSIRSETALQAVREAQSIVNAVQGHLNERIEKVAVDVAVLRHDRPRGPLIQGASADGAVGLPLPGPASV
jgi:hypothetical protein